MIVYFCSTYPMGIVVLIPGYTVKSRIYVDRSRNINTLDNHEPRLYPFA